LVQSDLLERSTISDVIYYFKDERSSGAMDKADSHLRFEGTKGGTIDAHGGWWDATGDYGKHLSHLSFSTYFNPQQSPLVVYSLLKSYEQANRPNLQGFARYKTRLLDEAMFGADYLVRMKVPGGSFYRSVSTGSVKQVPEERKIAGEMKRFGIESAPGQGAAGMVGSANNDREYEVSYRSGGGIAIAALAMASAQPVAGQFRSSDYLKAAEDAFDYLEKNNLKLTNDGKDNIVITFGSAQYRWHPTKEGGFPDPDGPAVRTSLNASLDTVYELPKASMTVIRGMIASSPTKSH
jgi:hypothetical protein